MLGLVEDQIEPGGQERDGEDDADVEQLAVAEAPQARPAGIRPAPATESR